MDFKALPANDLASLCANAQSLGAGAHDAWAEFVRRFQRPIALAVARTARSWGVTSPALIDDLTQDTFLRLCADDCRLLRSFTPREPDSILGYLKVIASNTTHDALRGEHSQKRGGNLDRHDPEYGSLDTLYPDHSQTGLPDRSLQLQEIDTALRRSIPTPLTERDRTIFWLYFQQGFSARDIGAITTIGLTVKGVESAIHRATRQVRQLLQPPAPKGFPPASTIYKEHR